MKIKNRMRAGERKSISRFREEFSGPRLLTGIVYRLAATMLPVFVLAAFGLLAYQQAHGANHHVGTILMAVAPVLVPSNIHALRQREIDLRSKATALHQKGVAESRAFNAQEQKDWDDIKAERALNQQHLDRELQFMQDEKNTPAADLPSASLDTKKKFATFGEQMVAVVDAGKTEMRKLDPRLLLASAAGASEAVPSDGGFAIQTDFQDTIMERMYEDGQILNLVDQIPIGSNSNGVRIPAIDEDSRVDGSRWGGLQAFWANEADPYTASKTKLRQIELRLNKLTGLSYLTDELSQDGPALGAFLMNAVPKEFRFKLEDALFNGTGSGQPLGIMNSGAVINVAKDSGDSGPTVSTPDVLSMWTRLFAGSRSNAVWFINQDVESKLLPLTLGSGTAVQLLYFPPGMNGNPGPYGRMLGRPVIPIEHCATLGTPGDIVLADMSQYLLGEKGGTQFASSIHVRFLTGENTLRWTLRVDGQPTWKKPLTPKNGTNTQSPFIALATRS